MKSEMGNILSIMTRPDSITICLKGSIHPHTVIKGQPNFPILLGALKDRDWEKVESALTPAKTISRLSLGAVEIVDDRLMLNGEEIKGYLVDKIFSFMQDNLPFEHLVAFLENLQANPSYRARNELYKFLETEDLPVTEDGHFLAYKRVRDNWKDIYTNAIDNSIGNVVEMPRVGVDDDPTHGCSAGLHAGSLSYVRGYSSGGHIIIVKINPKDVVSVPKHDVRKLRTCRYEVLKEMSEELLFPSYSKNGSEGFGSYAGVRNSWDDENYDDLYDSMVDEYGEEEDDDYYDDNYPEPDPYDWDIDTVPEIEIE